MKLLAILFCYPAVSFAQSSTPNPEYKSPGTATVISALIPGGGSMYAGRTGKGGAILGAALGGVVLTAGGASTGNTGVTLAGLGLELGAWGYGIYTAGNDARKHNESLHASRITPTMNVASVSTSTGTHKQASVGVSIRL